MIILRGVLSERLTSGRPRHFALAIASGVVYFAGFAVIVLNTESKHEGLYLAAALIHTIGLPLAAPLWLVAQDRPA